jgi:hypothetical protein
MRARNLIAHTAALGAVLALSACAGGSHSAATTTQPRLAPQHLAKAQYVARMQQLGDRLGRTVAALYPLDSGPPHSAVANTTIAKLGRAQTTIGLVERSARAIIPPVAARPAHRRLIAAIAAVDRQVGKLAQSLRTNDTTTFDQFAQLPALRELNAATNALRKLGFDVVG